MDEKIGFRDTEAITEDIQKLALYSPNVACTKDTSAYGPMIVLQGGIIAELACGNGTSKMM